VCGLTLFRPLQFGAMNAFTDLIDANAVFATSFESGTQGAVPHERLAVVTCMDCRIDPLAILGLQIGDIHVLRNAGARVTSDVLRSLVKSVNQLEVERIAIIQHTDCGAAKITLPGLRKKVLDTTGNDPEGVEFHLIGDQTEALAGDIEIVRTYPYLPVGTIIGGFIFDVETGLLDMQHNVVID
jgi:carbonic anhydrase